MRTRLITALLAVLVLLAAGANVYVYYDAHKPEPNFRIDAADVARLEYRHYDLGYRNEHDFATKEEFFTLPFNEERTRVFTDPADIERVCDVLSTLFVREYDFDALDAYSQYRLLIVTFMDAYVFHMKDGSERIFVGGNSRHVYFEGHWCYVSAGEAYGYTPLSKVLNQAYNNSERMK